MKKLFLIAAFAGMALASCTTDESTFEGVEDGRLMNFVAADYVHQTRGEAKPSGTFSNSDYKVYGWYTGTKVAHFDPLTVSGSTAENGYESGYYWPDESLDFAAVSPADNARIAVTRNNNGTTTITYTFDGSTKKNDNATNLMHADFVTQQLNANKNNATVALGFRHALAKLDVKVHQNTVADNSLPTGVAGYEVVVTSLNITGIHDQGTYTVTENTINTADDRLWTDPAGAATWNIIERDRSLMTVTKAQNAKPTNYAPNDFSVANYYVMPQAIPATANVNIAYKVITYLETGGTTTKTVTKDVLVKNIGKKNNREDKITHWYANKHISYTFNINPVSDLTPITFSAKEETWNTEDGTHEF